MDKDKEHKRKISESQKIKGKKSVTKKGAEPSLKDNEGYGKKIAELQLKYDDTYDLLLRATAELENTKKRTQKEIENIFKYSNESIIQELIPIYESLDLSVSLAEKSVSTEKLKEGNKILLSMFRKLFEKNYIKEINPLNKEFNPDYHQAISTKEDKNLKDNQILEVVQKGYLLNDRVIKPALVIVIKNAKPT